MLRNIDSHIYGTQYAQYSRSCTAKQRVGIGSRSSIAFVNWWKKVSGDRTGNITLAPLPCTQWYAAPAAAAGSFGWSLIGSRCKFRRGYDGEGDGRRQRYLTAPSSTASTEEKKTTIKTLVGKGGKLGSDG